MNSEAILNNLNTVSQKLFKTVESQVYKVIDEILNIKPDIFNVEPLNSFIPENQINGIVIISNALIMIYVIYFVILQFINVYNGNEVKNPYKYVLKIIIVGIFVNNSYFICKEILNIFSGIDNGIDLFGKQLFGKSVTFSCLKDKISQIDGYLSNDLISLNGIIKSALSFGSITILLNLSIRYVNVILLILVIPFAILSISSNFTTGIFVVWLKSFVSNLAVQIFIKLILLIPLIYKNVDDITFKILLVGSIYLIYRVNSFVKEIFSGVGNTYSIKDIFKGEI